MDTIELLVKVGGGSDPRLWRDGQIIDIRPSGTYKEASLCCQHHLLIKTPLDYWGLRGSTDWLSTARSALDFTKFFTATDMKGKYPWEQGFNKNENILLRRKRDFFIDFKRMLDLGWISQSIYDNIYDKSKVQTLYLDRAFENYILDEETNTRLSNPYESISGTIWSNSSPGGSGTGGAYTIGAAGDFASLSAFEADLPVQTVDTPDYLTGDITAEHLNEQSALTANCDFTLNANGYKLLITAAAGAEHNGAAYGNGARVLFSSYRRVAIIEANDGEIDDVEISKLAFDVSGTATQPIFAYNCGDAGVLLVNRMLIKGGANSGDGFGAIHLDQFVRNAIVRNCIVYDFGNDNNAEAGVLTWAQHNSPYNDHAIYNNTFIGCYNGVRQGNTTRGSAVTTVKNNLIQSSQNVSFSDAGAGFGTTSKNVSEDANSPDASYQSKDLHTNSIFLDYTNKNFKLDSGGDATNLAIADDGDNLSGTFTDDIIGNTRSTWYIGASEIATSPPAAPTGLSWSYH